MKDKISYKMKKHQLKLMLSAFEPETDHNMYWDLGISDSWRQNQWKKVKIPKMIYTLGKC